MTNTFD